MNRTKLTDLIKQGETDRAEFKSSLSDANRIVEVVASFANAKGGTLVVGVRGKRILGVDVGKRTIESLVNKITDNTDPAIYPKIEILTTEGKTLLVVPVREGETKPYLAFGRPFIRVGNVTKLMKRNEYETLLFKRQRVDFDEKVCEGALLKDIDGERLQWFLRKARAERNLDIDSKTGTEEILNRLRLMKDEELTNAAILLFGKEPQRFFLQAETRCARFKGLNVTEPFIDMKVIGGDLFSHVEETERFVLRNISKAAWIEPGKIERQEKWEYPPDAIREAITNAVCHRDYESSGSVQIRIFDDRIEIWNPGQLPESLTVEDLKKKHESKPRNRLIARCFFLVKFIEEWGTGTNKIVDWCLKQDLPEPLFEEAAGSFVVNLRKFHITEEALQKLNERERAIIQRVQENQRITSGEIQRMFDVSRDTVNRYLKNLLERRLIDKRGKGKTTYYTLQ